MAVTRIRERRYEEADPASRSAAVLAALAFFGLGLLTLYIWIAAPQQGTMMGSIQDILRGLGGSLAPSLVGNVSQMAGGNLKAGLVAAVIFPLILVIALLILPHTMGQKNER